MIRDITIGQYYQTKSVIHRLDPRVKLLGTLLFIIALFSYKNPVGYALGIAFMCMVIKLSHVPVKFITKGLKGILMILCITVLINLFLTAGTPLISFWKITITYEGLAMAVTMIIRLILLIMGSSIVTLTTTPNNLTDGLEKGLGFMKVFHVPVGDVAMMMSIALRFIPILLEETDRIMKAQLARGADFENGNLIKRAKALVPVLVPLFVSAFRRAGDLAMAMEARCYRGGDGRTKMKPLVYKKRDAVAYIILFAFLVLSIWLGRWSVISGFFNNIYLNILK
ncbi:MAG: energy-coupling factor transporter transmembrane protein EcfT [Lachnospiraceae bacterium]|nr:energy-coupling factor transporter transmembrane protein EcfT [Lachnospiraceae bacterium]